MSKIITIMSSIAISLLAEQAFAQAGECDLTGLRKGKAVSCETSSTASNGMPGKVKAVINVERVKVNKASDEINPSKPDQEVEVFQISVVGEHSCEKCMTQVRTEQAILSPEVKQFHTYTELNNFILSEGKKKMEEAAKLAKDERQKQDSEERCLTRDGEKLTGKDRMECRIDRLGFMDEEKASDYFHKYLKDDLQAMLQSNNPQDQAVAMQLLNKMNTESSSEVVKSSVRDLAAYGQYNQKQNEMLNQITTMQANDPRRRVALQQLGAMKQQWGNYFQTRGFEINNMNGQVTDSLIQSMMAQDIAEYQRELDARYNAIAEQHRVNYQSGNSAANVVAAGQGRLARGAVNGYAGAPGGSINPSIPGQQPNYYPGQQQPNYLSGQQQPAFNQGPTGMVNGFQSTQPFGAPRTGYGKPMLGQPVR